MSDLGLSAVKAYGGVAQTIGGMAGGSQLGGRRCYPHSQHPLHQEFGMTHLLPSLLTETLGGDPIPPGLHQGSLGHVLLHGRELKTEGATQIAQDARMDGVHGHQRRRLTPLLCRAGSTSV